LLAGAFLLIACGEGPSGTLQVRIVDPALEKAVPARLEVVDEEGEAWVADEAVRLSFECIAAPLPDWAADFLTYSDRIENPHTGTTQFYVEGTASLELPPGRYRLRVFKGIEYEVASREVEIRAGETESLPVELTRWIDMPGRGWYGADDHLHVTRLRPEDDRRIGVWMRAEDLHVANLLQMGTVDQFSVTPQHDFGAAGEYRLGDTLLLAGQEHPRTHFLGHTITLGADRPIDLRDTYIVYERFWRAAKREGGLSGFAHWGIGPARDGLAIDAPRDLVFFLEVLQFEFPYYDIWYELLDLGVRLTPTAGTDFPCGVWSMPGRERFYTRLRGQPTRRSWLDGVRRGQTFVTNGPMIELRVGGAEIGAEIRLEEPGRLAFEGAVYYDPARDDVKTVELLRNGAPIPAPVVRRAPGELRFDVEHEVAESGWYALRVSGDKIGEAPMQPGPSEWAKDLFDRLSNFREAMERSEAFYAARSRVRPSAAHSAPIFVTVAGSAVRERTVTLARESLARLDALELRLGDDRVEAEEIWDWMAYSDGVSAEHLRRNRSALLNAIAEARARYEELIASAPD
jgi:hypothetical protein